VLPREVQLAWRRALSTLFAGLGPGERALLASLGVRAQEDRRTSPLLRFGACGGAAAAPAAARPPAAVLRLRTRRLRWSHRGVRLEARTALLELDGLPVARVKFRSDAAHKRGRAFRGRLRHTVLFDHGAKSGQGASAARPGASEAAASLS